jgi:hypothetical protein
MQLVGGAQDDGGSDLDMSRCASPIFTSHHCDWPPILLSRRAADVHSHPPPCSLPHFLPSAALWGMPSPTSSLSASSLNTNAREFVPVFEDDDQKVIKDNNVSSRSRRAGSNGSSAPDETPMLPSFVVTSSAHEWGRARYDEGQIKPVWWCVVAEGPPPKFMRAPTNPIPLPTPATFLPTPATFLPPGPGALGVGGLLGGLGSGGPSLTIPMGPSGALSGWGVGGTTAQW